MTPLEVSGYGLTVVTLLVAVGVLVEPSSSLPFGLLSSWLHSAGAAFYSLLSFCLPRSLLSCCSRLSTYLFHRRNPVFQLLYAALMLGCYALFVVYALPSLPPTSVHHYVHPFVFATALLSFAAACQPPTFLSAANLSSALQRYPSCPLLYCDGLACPTCQLVKPPRSKHCSVCRRCVLRFDHHCVWVNQCVGEGNHRYFLAFLVVHSAFLVYGAWLLQHILRGVLFESPQSPRFPRTWHFYAQYLSYYHHITVGLLFLASSLSLLLAGFTAYHLFLVGTNQTTNERHKRGDVRAGRNPLLHWECLPLIEREKAAQALLRRVQGQLLRMDDSLAAQHTQWSAILREERASASSSSEQSAVQLSEAERAERCGQLFDKQAELKAEIDQCREEVDRRQQEEDERAARGEGRVKHVPNPYNNGWLSNWRELLSGPPHAQTSEAKPRARETGEEQTERAEATRAGEVHSAVSEAEKEHKEAAVATTAKRRKQRA